MSLRLSGSHASTAFVPSGIVRAIASNASTLIAIRHRSGRGQTVVVSRSCQRDVDHRAPSLSSP